MTKYLLPTLGLALLWGSRLPRAGPHGSPRRATRCCGTAGCEAGCGNTGCAGVLRLLPALRLQTGSRLPVTCTTKKTTEHKYCCTCKEICIPGVTRIGERCEGCENWRRRAGATGAPLVTRATTAARMAVIAVAGSARSTS